MFSTRCTACPIWVGSCLRGWWCRSSSGMDRRRIFVHGWADTYTVCQRSKVQRHIKAPLAQFPVPERRFDHVNVDFAGPLAPSLGFSYLLTMVDRTTRWLEAVPQTGTTTTEMAQAFIGMWVARFVTPSDISSDRGSQFTSDLWVAVAQSLGLRLHQTASFLTLRPTARVSVSFGR